MFNIIVAIILFAIAAVAWQIDDLTAGMIAALGLYVLILETVE